MKIFEIITEAAVLDVVKDDDKQTTLVDKASGVTTIVDKKNPKSPKLQKDEKGQYSMGVPKPGATTKPVPITPGTKVAVKPQV